MAFGARVWKRGWRRELDFGRRLKHEIVVPPGPDGRPGERLCSPSASLLPPWPLGPDGSREDFRVFLGTGGTHFGGVCLGPVAERGDPVASAHATIGGFAQRGNHDVSAVEPEVVANEPGCRYRIEFPRSVLVEWKFARHGWLFAVGALCRQSDREQKMVQRARDILATWMWIDDDARGPLPARPAPD